ncbi:MAG: hypothetical protein CME71_12020 [Halobacteriovorax sp.]|nr:hypothetical protein [Halobacteriovorax sp.]
MKLFKSLTVFAIILSLFSFHIETRAISFSSAYAAEEENQDEGDKTFVSDKDPNIAHLDYRESEQKIGKQSVAQMMTILAMLMGPSIAMACFQPISGKIFAAGGVAYLAMEVMNYGKYKKASTSNQEMYATLDPDTADKQIDASTYAEQQELAAADALGKKASALNIFFMAMTAAAVMAIIEGVRALVPSQQGSDACTGTVTNIDIKKLLNNGFNGAFDFVFPKAMAKEAEKVQGPMGTMGILSLAAGAILAYKGVAKGFLQSALSNGFVRAAVFGVFAGFAMAAKAEVNKAKKKAEENAAVYASLRDRLIQALNGASQFAGMGGVQGALRDRLGAYQGIRDEMNNLNTGAICLVGKLGEQRVDQQCLCAKNNTCSKAEFSSVGLTNQGLPSSFASGLDNLASGANSLFAGNTAAADSSFGNLSQGATGLRKLKKQMTAKANGILKKSKTPTSMEKLESQMEKELRRMAPGILNSLPADAAALASGTGLSGTSIAASDLEKAKDGDLKDVLASISSNAAAPAAQKGVGEFKFDFPEDTALDASSEQFAQMEQEKAGMGEFTESGSDISSRPFENIFKIITVRYFKSAYPRIFEEDKRSTLE